MKATHAAQVLLIMICLVLVPAGQSRALTLVWIALYPPSSPPAPGSTFTTDLRISSWNGASGALDMTIRYDPSVLELAAFELAPDSPFYPDCFVHPAAHGSGQARIVCFQVTDSDAWDIPFTLGSFTWEVVGTEGLATDVTLESITAVATGWGPVEVLAYGQHITAGYIRIYLPVILRGS